MIVTGLQGTQYNLDAKRLSDGGEGEIFRVLGGSDKIAKIYKPDVPSRELEEKLKFMVGNQPTSTVLNQVAWPLDIIYQNNQFCGFIMPELKINAELGGKPGKTAC
ncbi:hypothetical protein FACS189445_6700 [Spirochaetia bacterium]|nr:hypothetical protein FACS189445_6700 [Spirochaetia bacterium]